MSGLSVRLRLDTSRGLERCKPVHTDCPHVQYLQNLAGRMYALRHIWDLSARSKSTVQRWSQVENSYHEWTRPVYGRTRETRNEPDVLPNVTRELDRTSA
jgi:hypothetical protein